MNPEPPWLLSNWLGSGVLRRDHGKPARDAGQVENVIGRTRSGWRRYRAHVLDGHVELLVGLSVGLEDRQALFERVLVEREFLRSVEEAAADAGRRRAERELVVEQEERVPGGRDLGEVVEQGGSPPGAIWLA